MGLLKDFLLGVKKLGAKDLALELHSLKNKLFSFKEAIEIAEREYFHLRQLKIAKENIPDDSTLEKAQKLEAAKHEFSAAQSLVSELEDKLTQTVKEETEGGLKLLEQDRGKLSKLEGAYREEMLACAGALHALFVLLNGPDFSIEWTRSLGLIRDDVSDFKKIRQLSESEIKKFRGKFGELSPFELNGIIGKKESELRVPLTEKIANLLEKTRQE